MIEKATVQNWSNKSNIDDEIHIFYQSEKNDKQDAMDEEKDVDLSSPEALFSKQCDNSRVSLMIIRYRIHLYYNT